MPVSNTAAHLAFLKKKITPPVSYTHLTLPTTMLV